MIPGTDVMIEDLLLTHSKEVGLQYFDEITENELIKNKFDAVGVSANTLLSHIDKKYNLLSGFVKDFEKRYEAATDKETLLNRTVTKIQSSYERVLPGNDYISLLLNADGVTKWHWPADYVAYHCKIEGYNPQLHNLTICVASELGFEENVIIEKLESVLQDLAKGYSMALFHEYLLQKQTELLGFDHNYVPYASLKEASQDKINWSGSPIQFVQIIKLLIKNGFLDLNVSQGNQVIALMKHFEINSQRGGVAFNTLRGYFSNRNVKLSDTDAYIPPAEDQQKTSAKK